jgi:hypothetical protein
VDGDAKNERIPRMRDLSCRCLRYVDGKVVCLNLAKLCGVGPKNKQETYDYPVVTLLPHIETPLEQPHVAELIRRLFLLLHANFIPRIIFVRYARVGCSQIGQGSKRDSVSRYMMQDWLSNRSWRWPRSRFVG